MNRVYVVTHGYDYEGESVDGVYSTLDMARLHLPGKGHFQRIYRYDMDSGHYREMPLTRGGKV